MIHTIERLAQRARYVAIGDPTAVEGYVDELCQEMGASGLKLCSVIPQLRGGDTLGFWLFFSKLRAEEPKSERRS